MQRVIRYGFLMLLLGAGAGCGQKGARLQKSVVPPDKTLFETGQEYLQKSQFIKARLAYQTLINTYPDSELTAESYLAIGDSFYDEGGTENLLQSEDQYKNFIIFFPTHPKAEDAQIKIASLRMRMMRAPDRDPQHSFAARDALLKYQRDFPDGKYASVVQTYLDEVEENLAQREYGIASFYAGRGNYKASKSRLEDIEKDYKRYSLMDEALYLLAESYEKSEESEKAAASYAKIAQGYPFSKYFELSKKRLEALGKPVPEVDTLIAAQNQARLKPAEPFSPLKPFTEFAKALGFMGPPDRYENARRTVEGQQEAAAQASKPADGAKTGDDILIERTLTKSKTGETQVGAMQGANPGGSSKPQAKKDDKKSDTKKNNKKPNDKKDTKN